MGDRSKCHLYLEHQPEGTRLEVYGHWVGQDMALYVREALQRARPRWDDAEYGPRIFLSVLFERCSNDVLGCGFGFRTAHDDGYPPVEVCWPERTVTIGSLRMVFQDYVLCSNEFLLQRMSCDD
jgi:hypothetical protein